DSGALATALGEVLASPALRHKLAIAGRRHVMKRFRWDAAAVQVADVYRKVISAHR
ncbi:MAG: glycosyltransferase, partial [SAR324 cluster bacterium]|nr:glycosyltransferase [SAR324 cluster bacterium]